MCVNLFMRLLLASKRAMREREKSFHANTCHPTIKYYYNRSSKKKDFRRNKLHDRKKERIEGNFKFNFSSFHSSSFQHLSHINSFVMLRVIELAASD